MGEVFQSKVRDLSLEGLGVLDHSDGRIAFVQGAWPGDEIEYEIIREKKNYLFVKLRQLLKASSERVQADCPHQGSEMGECGGCPWMIAEYSAQLQWKQEIVKRTLERALEEDLGEKLKDIWPSPKILGYRNRAQFKTDGTRIGFLSPGSHELAAIEDCLVLSDKNRGHLRNLRAMLPNSSWNPTPPNRWNFFEIDDELENVEDLSINTRREFRQGNTDQNKRMQEWLVEKLSRFPKESEIFELFCGRGNFTEVISKLDFRNILAVEASEAAVESLNSQQFTGVKALAFDIYNKSNWKRLKKIYPEPKILILDPPRLGFGAIRHFVTAFPSIEKIFYISCHLKHFARDVLALKKVGWSLKEVQPLDQFPHTVHIELLSVFSRDFGG